MNVLAVSGSPRMEKGNTDKILKPFLEGMGDAGAAVETLYVKRLNIAPCQGCFNCHWKTPGACVIQDDMKGVMEKMYGAEIIVFATPLYVFSASAQLKALMDRMIVVGDLTIDLVDGIAAHPPRKTDLDWKWILISNAGFPELEHFEPLVDMFRRFARAIGGGKHVELSAAICKGMGELLSVKPLIPGFQWFFDTCRQAGKEFVQHGVISEATQEVLNRPLMDISPAEFVELANVNIKKAAKLIREKSAG